MVQQVTQRPDFNQVVSDIVAVASVIDIEGKGVRSDWSHCFVGVEFFADAGGASPATPGAGSVTVTVQTINNPQAFEGIPDNVIDATAPTTPNYNGGTKIVRMTPAGITVATHYRAIWSVHRS